MRRYFYVYGCIFYFLTATHLFSQDADYTDQTLPPLRRVVFYNSGVAHMQHRGTVDGKTRLAIRFSSHDVDDVLKSLVFEDQGGGLVRAVEYQPAPNPEDVAANSFGPMTLAQLLQKYRGESIFLSSGDVADTEEQQGQIFGLENRQFGAETAEVLVVIDDAGGMRSVRLNDIQRVRFANKEVQDEMKLAMTGVAKSRKANQKQLDLLFDGEGERQVAFGYVVDAPIWRMSYRLEVKPEQVQLQGWTHINNVTGVDWEDVTVELRSGQPQTFHAELFAPVLAERQSVGLNPFGLPEELILVRQWYGFEPAERFGSDRSGDDFGGKMGGGMGGGMMGGMGGFGGGGGYGGGYGGGGGSDADNNSGRTAAKGIDSETAFQQIASLDRTATMVRFQLDKPVSLASGKSAALPVFKQQLPSRLLSVVKHSESVSSLTAVRAIELTNATQFALVPGPIHVSQDGDFVGDAQIPRLAIGATEMLPYSVDRAVQVTRTKTPNRKTATSVSLVGKRIVSSFENKFEVRFQIDNQDKDARLMLIEYLLPELLPQTSEAKGDPFEGDPFGGPDRSPADDAASKVVLRISPAAKKRENRLLTYEVPAAALAKTDFTIQVSWPEQRPESLRNVSPARAAAWLNSKIDIDDMTKTKLTELVAISNKLAANLQRIEQLTAQKSEYVKEQSRIRENLSVVGAGTAAAEPFLKRMNEMEASILDVIIKLSEAQNETNRLAKMRNEL